MGSRTFKNYNIMKVQTMTCRTVTFDRAMTLILAKFVRLGIYGPVGPPSFSEKKISKLKCVTQKASKSASRGITEKTLSKWVCPTPLDEKVIRDQRVNFFLPTTVVDTLNRAKHIFNVQTTLNSVMPTVQ